MPRLTKTELNPEVEKLTKKFKKDGLVLFKEELPKRIEQLTKELAAEDFLHIRIDDFELSQAITDKLDKILASGGDQLNRSRKRKVDAVSGNSETAGSAGAATPSGSAAGAEAFANATDDHTKSPLPSNVRIVRMMRLLKEQYTDALEIAGTLKMWIQLNVPRIEDGNNFGVDVQTECITEISNLEDKCCGVLESTTKYFSGRAKLLSKCIKYPDVEDYRRSIEEVDHSTFSFVYARVYLFRAALFWFLFLSFFPPTRREVVEVLTGGVPACFCS